jgi:hypothetical protein
VLLTFTLPDNVDAKAPASLMSEAGGSDVSGYALISSPLRGSSLGDQLLVAAPALFAALVSGFKAHV